MNREISRKLLDGMPGFAGGVPCLFLQYGFSYHGCNDGFYGNDDT
jgi:hypothetical protein